MTDRDGRTAAERVTFAVSCLIVLVVVGLIAGQLAGDEQPPTPTASASEPAARPPVASTCRSRL